MKQYDVMNSPFIELATPFTAWEAFKMILLLPTLPVRLAIAVAAISALAVFNSLAVWGCDLDKTLPHWRRRLVEISSQTCARVMLLTVGCWRLTVKGVDNYRRGQQMGAVGVFNHVSYLDAWLLVCGFCGAGLAFAQYTKHVPVLGRAIKALQCVYLSDSMKQNGNMVQHIKNRASTPSMPMLSVAPEGTCGNGRCLLKFKTGAFAAGKPVVPILWHYKLTPHNPAWTQGIIPFWHLLRVMCQFSNAVTMEVLPPYIPSPAELDDPSLYAANVRKLMANTLGVPLVDQDRNHFVALGNAGISVSWDGCRIVAPPGVVDEHGMCDLEPYMPGNSKLN